MKVLVVEDEPNVISLLQRGLAAPAYDLSVAMDGQSGLDMATRHQFDAIILDLMLPVMNGMEVCRRLREHNSTTPVLMLTALGTTENIVSGLDSGADDYLTKPFKLAELEARLRTIIRRRSGASVPGQEVLRMSDLVLNTTTKTVVRNQEPVTLTATEFRLLEFLLRNPEKVLSRLQILEHVWDINFNLGTNVVDVYINYLRKKIEKGSAEKLIHTVFGMGYVMRESK